MKGAFKHLPPNQQPEPIPVDKYDVVAKAVESHYTKLGKCFIPSIEKTKQAGKEFTGDLDVIIDPDERDGWQSDILAHFKECTIANTSNGPQLMMVINFDDVHRYMVDFILAKDGSFDYRSKYAKFGTIIPAVVGSFARSLGYKFDQNGFYLRVRDRQGNYHNMLLTTDFDIALDILLLDRDEYNDGKLYSAKDVAVWVGSSPRFDSAKWHSGNHADKE